MNDISDLGFREDPLIYARHPDPAWARRDWLSLDGVWKIRHGGREESILVPFPVGSEASGVDFEDSGSFVYSRSFDYPGLSRERRYELHVGACDYEAEVFLNGRRLGKHRGGYASFSFDVTEALLPRDNRIEVRVRDSHSARQARGKQTFRKKAWFVWYDGIAGIWQPVWIEETGASFVESAKLQSDFSARRVEARVVARGVAPSAAKDCGPGFRLEANVTSPSGEGYRFSAGPQQADGSFRLGFSFDEVGGKLWSPEDPALYAIEYRLFSGDALCDVVESYFGLRSVAARGASIELNGKPVFLRMALVQGYYPGGVYTPLSYGVIERDIEALKRMGFNGARVHEKIESPYFHYLCDRMGLLCSYEMPSFYLPSKAGFKAYEGELEEIIARDSMHPSCIFWILFNETWGVWGIYRRGSRTRRFVESMLALVRAEDPGRPVIENSGWEHFDTDIVDFHHYLGTAALAKDLYARLAARDEKLLHGFTARGVLDFYLNDRVATGTRTVFLERGADAGGGGGAKPLFLSEYGGFGWYSISEKGSTIEKIETYTRDILDSRIFCGYCLTQLYDVGGEVNGLLSFDRKPKMDLDRLREINSLGPA